MTGAEALDAALEPRPSFRGPLANQRPRIVRTFGSDPWLVLAVAALVSLGMVMVFNVSYFPGGDDFGDPLHFFRKHVVSIALGIVALRDDDAGRVGSLSRPGLSALLASRSSRCSLVLIPGIGSVRSGARRWLSVRPAHLPAQRAGQVRARALPGALARPHAASGCASSGTASSRTA